MRLNWKYVSFMVKLCALFNLKIQTLLFRRPQKCDPKLSISFTREDSETQNLRASNEIELEIREFQPRDRERSQP